MCFQDQLSQPKPPQHSMAVYRRHVDRGGSDFLHLQLEDGDPSPSENKQWPISGQ